MASSVRYRVNKEYPEYTISSDGKVFHHFKEMKQYFPKNDLYCRAKITIRDKSGKSKTVLVSRLIHETFGPSPPTDKHTQVDHIDNNPLNNKAENLQWITPRENNQKASKLRVDVSHQSRRNLPMIFTDKYTHETLEFVSLGEAARYFDSATSTFQKAYKRGWYHHFIIEPKRPKLQAPELKDHIIIGERWELITSIPVVGWYISDHGRLRQIVNGKELLQHDPNVYPTRLHNKSGCIQGYYYHTFTLTKTNDSNDASKRRGKSVFIHRLVATHFSKVKGHNTLTSDSMQNLDVSHIDAVSTNNHWSNLEWVTRLENMTNTITRQKNSNSQIENWKKRKREHNDGDIFKFCKRSSE